MKTTVEISDSLLDEVRRLAARRGLTVRQVVEESLRQLVSSAGQRQRAGFKLRDASFKGQGLQEGVAEGDWRQVRDLAYEGRGA